MSDSIIFCAEFPNDVSISSYACSSYSDKSSLLYPYAVNEIIKDKYMVINILILFFFLFFLIIIGEKAS